APGGPGGRGPAGAPLVNPRQGPTRIIASLRPFWPVAVLAAYDSIGFELVGPVLPAIRTRAGATALEASLIFAVFSLGMLAGFAAGGAVVRRAGPRAAAVRGGARPRGPAPGRRP